MTGILQFETAHGTVSVEVDDPVAAAAGSKQPGEESLTAKGGYVPAGAEAGEIVAKATATFSEAMESFKAYAGGLADIVDNLDIAPEEVSFEIGLKMSGSTGFIIAKAGGEAEMKVALTWKPKARPPA